MAMEEPEMEIYSLPLWLDRVYSDNEAEVLDDVPVPLVLIPWEGRLIIWNLTDKFLRRDSYGVAGQACQLLERYLGACFRRFAGLSAADPAVRRQYQLMKYKLCSNIIMLAGVCIQLSAKMNSAVVYVSARELQSFLRQHERYYALIEINRAEAEVFATIGYRIPLWTNVEKARLLARELRMGSSEIMRVVALAVDVAEFSRLVVQYQIHGIVFERHEGDEWPLRDRLGISNIRNMHLIAGAIAAACIFGRFSGPDPVARLARFTRCPVSYVICIRNSILGCMNVIKEEVRRSALQPRSSRRVI